MVLRVVVASAAVSRKAGRGRHRLGAFSLRDISSVACAGCSLLVCSIIFVDAMLFTRADAARARLRRGVRPLEGRSGTARRRLRRRRALRRASRAGSPRRVSARKRAVVAGPRPLSVSPASRSRSPDTRCRARRSPASSRASQHCRPGPERSHGCPSRCRPEGESRRGHRNRVRRSHLRRDPRPGLRRARRDLVSIGSPSPSLGVVTFVFALLASRRAPRRRGASRRPSPALGRALRDQRFLGGLWLNMLPAMLFGLLILLPRSRSTMPAGATLAIAAVFFVAGARRGRDQSAPRPRTDRLGVSCRSAPHSPASTVVALALAASVGSPC